MGHSHSEMYWDREAYQKEKEKYELRQQKEIEKATKNNHDNNFSIGDLVLVHPNLLKKSKVNMNSKNTSETSETLWDIIKKGNNITYIPKKLSHLAKNEPFTVYDITDTSIRTSKPSNSLFSQIENHWYDKKYFVLHQKELF